MRTEKRGGPERAVHPMRCDSIITVFQFVSRPMLLMASEALSMEGNLSRALPVVGYVVCTVVFLPPDYSSLLIVWGARQCFF